MSLSLYDASVPVLKQQLAALGHILEKAEAHVAQKKLEPAALLQARLFPDMFPFTRQVQIACDFAKGMSARLAGVPVPVDEDTEQSFAELRARVARTLAFLGSLDRAAFEGSGARHIVLRPGTPKERSFNGQDYLLHYALPQFYFHATTAYALLRHNGLEIGKLDFMGAAPAARSA
ncbi:MAG TPA: DUF1993 domain-containing protein [Aggregicoccus sp.]|nr:DUF1993 domain-containing protein [Aggregicoccus sp.]